MAWHGMAWLRNTKETEKPIRLIKSFTTLPCNTNPVTSNHSDSRLPPSQIVSVYHALQVSKLKLDLHGRSVPYHLERVSPGCSSFHPIHLSWVIRGGSMQTTQPVTSIY
ncbi:hypothetical protein AVEN_159224-1 [Araneus ventricosus]|uniref:Uncharacterized protein n=1 Tax=Araneus ventricosus TaxID=182803 RepID=A0A4Y2A036_ARAVE|nr:hypothetical protein AVEN_159224-1 [Araneus ventricosus]